MKTKQIILFAIVLFFIACKNSETSNQDISQKADAEIQQMQAASEEVQTTETVGITIEKAKQYVAKGFKLVVQEDEANLLTGDFNGDGLEDFAMIIASDDAEMYQDAVDVRIVIFENNGKGFTEKAKSGNLGGFFVHQAPTSQLSLNKNIISLTYQGMRYDDEWKFRYEKKYDDYMLIGSEHNSYGNAVNDGSGNMSSNYLSGVRLENFNKWDEQKEELKELPEKKTKVSKTLLPLSKFNETNYADL